MKISALLISYNEQDNIQRFINEASLYADEIIIVDSFSTDKTEELALNEFNPKVRFIKHKFNNFTSQRNYALSLARNEWITFFDADEVVDDRLRKEIIFTIKNNPEYDAYYVYRKFFFKKKYVRFTGMQNDKVIRLFRKSIAKYKSNLLVHEELELNEKVGFLKNKVNHLTFRNENEYKEKLNKYSKLRAQELRLKNIKPTIFHYKIKPAYRFFNYFILRLGFLDGIEGYKISKLHAISIANRYKYLDEIYKKEKF